MANLRNNLPDLTTSGDAVADRLARCLRKSWDAVQPHLSESRAPHIRIAYSGGLDSTVLLHLLAATRTTGQHALRSIGPVSAFHVHHGLSSRADAWVRHCRSQCRTLGVPFSVRRAVVDRSPRTSLEEEARRVRYQLLLGPGADVVALAHHADDQAETVLLQLLRGAGPKGLAAMPGLRTSPTNSLPIGLLWRPLLDCTRSQLEAYARLHQLEWIDDESNRDLRIRRNFLRAEVMPLLARGFGQPVIALVRTARHLAAAAQLADALGDIDIALAQRGDALDVCTLKALDDVRLANLLRRWIERKRLRAPSERRLHALVRALRQSSNDTRLMWQHDGRTVLRKKGFLVFA